jgi:diguanylate cyclase (GGDEF)-like protein
MRAVLALAHLPTLMLAVVMMFLAAALVWAVLGRHLRLLPSASALLALANLLLGLALVSEALRGLLPHWLSDIGSDLLGVAGFAVLRAAVPVVAERPPAWRLGLLVWPLLPEVRQVALSFGAISLLMLVACAQAWGLLRQELRPLPALGQLFPLLLVTLAVSARFVHALLWPGLTAPLGEDSSFNTLWLWLALLLCLLMNAAMAFLIVLRLVLRIQRLTLHDPLTDALNRRAFAQALERAQAGLRRGRPYALLLLDLDHFKPLNDSLGHAAGDAALCAVAASLRGALRSTDSLGRLGGEEFCVLLSPVEPGSARQVAQRLCERLQALDFRWEGRPWPLSASIGLALARPDEHEAEAVLLRADAAMYAAKQAGRNQVREG